ncbi:MAG: nitroreductase family deazaflavin-dependent oxidoreductase [Nitrososphaerota archaeon]|jgi:deazaflavin-dependent oxidoreductase (nitroreductase family)|nr:nitroreductase family deazaflavin-dependent oxidoreductase [Nitrososphaerota archaeon]
MVKAVQLMNGMVMLLYRASGGRVANHMQKAPIMLLTTIGSKSGKERTNPVLYVTDGEDLVTVASAGGAPKNPQWFVNLMHRPEAVVTIGKEKRKVSGRVASPEERSRLWPRLTAVYSAYDEYAKKTKREIPVVILTPAP